MGWFRKKKKNIVWNKKYIPKKEHIPFDSTAEKIYDPINPPPNLRGIISGGLDENKEKEIYKKRLLRGETEKSAKGGLKHYKK